MNIVGTGYSYEIMPRINTEYRDEAKKKIIAAAMDIAATEGWHAVTLESIAQKIGVTKGAFYSYFESSNALTQEVIMTIIREHQGHQVSAFARTTDVNTALDHAANDLFIKPKRYIPLYIQTIITCMPQEPVFRKEIFSLIDESTARFAEALLPFQKSGQIPKDVDLASAVRGIYAMNLGLDIMMYVLGGGDPETAKKIWVAHTKEILHIAI